MFNQSKYKQEYNKEHYKTFKVDLKVEEYEQLEKYLEKVKLTKAQFLRYCILLTTKQEDSKIKKSK